MEGVWGRGMINVKVVVAMRMAAAVIGRWDEESSAGSEHKQLAESPMGATTEYRG